MKSTTPAQTIAPWLRANLGKHCCAGLTGQDWFALRAAVQTIAAYGYCDCEAQPRILHAFRNLVLCIQPNLQELAYHAIAHVLDWSHREQLWRLALLPALVSPRKCVHE